MVMVDTSVARVIIALVGGDKISFMDMHWGLKEMAGWVKGSGKMQIVTESIPLKNMKSLCIRQKVQIVILMVKRSIWMIMSSNINKCLNAQLLLQPNLNHN